MQILVNGDDISDTIGNWQDVQLTQVLTKETSKLQFTMKFYGDRILPQLGDQVDLYVNSGTYHYFGGTVAEVQITNLGGLLLAALITATDWAFKMDSKLVVQNYENMDPQDIVRDIVNNYTDGTYTTDGVQKGNFLVPSIRFNYEPVTKSLQKLATMIGWDWNVSPNKDVHFFLSETNPAPFGIDDTSGNLEWPTLDWGQDIINMKNSVFVIGANYKKTFTAITTPDVYTSVAGTFVYPLAYPYDKNTLVITLGGVSQTIGVDRSTPDADVQVQYNDKGRFIRFTSDPGAASQIKIYGDAIIPILAHSSNATAIALYGEKQDSIVDKQITSVTEAHMRAMAEVNLYGSPVNILKFNTVRSGLFAGQQITFNSPIFQAIYGTTSLTMLIRRVTAAGYSPFQLKYQIECYGSAADQVSFVDIISVLLQRENNDNTVDESTVLQDLAVLQENIAISEAVTASLATPPYQWGPDGSPQMVWDFFTWYG